MRIYKNLTVIGTSHISADSVKEVEGVILNLRPKIVALELDKDRLQSLLHKKEGVRLRDIKELGVIGFLFNIVGAWVERKLGEKVGTVPGDEMRKAIRCSHNVGAKVVLIDQNIKITIKIEISRTRTLFDMIMYA